jgi:hypothetical protein
LAVVVLATSITNVAAIATVPTTIAGIKSACFVAVTVAVSAPVAAGKVVAPRWRLVGRSIAVTIKRWPTLHCSFRTVVTFEIEGEREETIRTNTQKCNEK